MSKMEFPSQKTRFSNVKIRNGKCICKFGAETRAMQANSVSTTKNPSETSKFENTFIPRGTKTHSHAFAMPFTLRSNLAPRNVSEDRAKGSHFS